MKKIYLVMFAMLLVSSMAMAQNDDQSNNMQQRKAPDATEMATRQTERMVKQYSLNDTQKAALLTLNKKYASKMGQGRGMGMRKNSSSDNSSNTTSQKPDQTQIQKMNTERTSMMTEYNNELQKILTTDQYSKYTKNMKSHGQNGQKCQKGQKGQKGQNFQGGQNQEQGQGRPDDQGQD